MEPVTTGDLTIEPGWARASATPGAKAGAAFFTIHNKGGSDGVLVGADGSTQAGRWQNDTPVAAP